MYIEEKYSIKERAENDIEIHGSIEKAIEYLKSELNECENLWSKYSSDCLGHAITCNRLKLSYLLERK